MFASVEIYDSKTGKWTIGAPMEFPRSQHTATLLPNGQILVAGGFNSLGDIDDVSIYDPRSDIWVSVGALSQGRGRHTATLLNYESVLIVGGINDTSALNPGTSQMVTNPRTGVDLFFLDGAPDDLLPTTPEVGDPG